MAFQLAAKDCSVNQPLASLTWEGGNIYRQLTVDWSTQANASGILPRSAWHWSVDSSAINYSLGAPGRTPLYLCHPTVGELQVVTVISPLLVQFFMEKKK
jgi:hypothetical protein